MLENMACDPVYPGHYLLVSKSLQYGRKASILPQPEKGLEQGVPKEATLAFQVEKVEDQEKCSWRLDF